MKFDPKKTKRSLRELMIEYCRNREFSDVLENRAFAGSADTILTTAIECLLVGLFDVGKELLLKARIFLWAAIERNEIPRVYGKGLTECQRMTNYALCLWLMYGRHDEKSWKAAAEWTDVWFQESPKTAKRDIQFALTEYLEAGQYERVIERFEWAGAKKPASLRHIRSEGSMCYVIARQRLGLEYTREEIDAATETFLKRSVPEWLGWQGREIDAARWMKLAHWKKGDDPTATLLRCYDYLAGLKPPKYPCP
jgi:hypothetical protein